MKPRLHAMKLMTTLLVCCFSLHGLECAGAGPEELPQLQWANGDQLAGQLLSADDRFLEWKAPIFEQPFVIDLNTIQSLTFPVTEKQGKTDQPFRIFTRSGDVLNGDFVTISDGNITFKTERHGEIVLDRDEVRSFRRLNDPALIFDGPSGVEEWSTISRARSATDWKQLPQGGLTTQVVSAELYKKRPDLVNAGRTLFGRLPPRHQSGDLNYFGATPGPVEELLIAVQTEMMRMGSPMVRAVWKSTSELG